MALDRVITDDQLTPRDLLTLAQAMRNLDTRGVNSYTIEWSPRKIGNESVLIPIVDSDSMKAILAIFDGSTSAKPSESQASDAAPSGDENASAGRLALDRTAAAIFVPLAATLIDVLVSADDASPTTTIAAPQQKRLGVFPPDDPACR